MSLSRLFRNLCRLQEGRSGRFDPASLKKLPTSNRGISPCANEILPCVELRRRSDPASFPLHRFGMAEETARARARKERPPKVPSSRRVQAEAGLSNGPGVRDLVVAVLNAKCPWRRLRPFELDPDRQPLSGGPLLSGPVPRTDSRPFQADWSFPSSNGRRTATGNCQA